MISIKKTKKRKGGKRGRPKTSTRLRVEDCARIAVRQCPFTGPLPLFGSPQTSLSVTWSDGTEQQVTLKGTVTKQRLGGQRWWFRCPKCDQRVRCVYSPAQGQPFRCRKCWDLTYTSQAEPPNSFRNWFRLLSKPVKRSKRRPDQFYYSPQEANRMRRLYGREVADPFLLYMALIQLVNLGYCDGLSEEEVDGQGVIEAEKGP